MFRNITVIDNASIYNHSPAQIPPFKQWFEKTIVSAKISSCIRTSRKKKKKKERKKEKERQKAPMILNYDPFKTEESRCFITSLSEVHRAYSGEAIGY